MPMDQTYPPSEQAPLRRYGEQAMVETEAPPASPSTQRTEKRINWGQVLKGVAIVTGAILVVVVAMHFGGVGGDALFTWLNGIPGVGEVTSAVVNGVHWVVGFLGQIGHHIWSGITSLFGGFAASPYTAAQAGEAGRMTVGLLAGGAAIGATAPLILKSTSALQIVDSATTTVTPPGGTEHGAAGTVAAHQSHSATTAAKIGHTAAEPHDHRPRPDWMHRVNASAAYQRTLAQGGSFADAARAAHDRVMAGVRQRNTSFSQQLNADRVQLEQLLKDNTR